MKKILLNSPKYGIKEALVDDADYPVLSQITWWPSSKDGRIYRFYAKGYLGHGANRKPVTMHRFIMDAPDGVEIDHIDGNGLNNQKSNLRICTTLANMCNRPKQRNNTSGYKGVVFLRGKWMVQLKYKRRSYYGGVYLSPKEAAVEYDRLAKKLHGKFSSLNFANEDCN